jgi:hypothetical protein
MGTGGSKGFQDGVKSVTTLPIVFLNPADFHREHFLKTREVHPDDIKKARNVIRLQGVDDSGFSDKQLTSLVRRSLAGPFGHAMDVDDVKGNPMRICLANGPEGAINGRSDSLLKQAGIDPAKLSLIPGWEQHRERIFGIHEGTHCAQDMNTKGMTDEQKDIFLMGREAEADRAAVKWLRDNKLPEVAQALIDIRALGSLKGDDPRHATAVLIDRPDLTSSQAHIDAVHDFRFQMVMGVMTHYKLTMEQVVDMSIKQPAQYVDRIEKLLARGAFSPAQNADVKSNPLIEDYIRAYAGAYRRQIIDRPLTPAPSTAPVQPPAAPAGNKQGSLDVADGEERPRYALTGSDLEDGRLSVSSEAEGQEEAAGKERRGAPVVALGIGDQAVLTIDGVSAPDYWRQMADPVFALQRLALKDTGLEGQNLGNQAVSVRLPGGQSNMT